MPFEFCFPGRDHSSPNLKIEGEGFETGDRVMRVTSSQRGIDTAGHLCLTGLNLILILGHYIY